MGDLDEAHVEKIADRLQIELDRPTRDLSTGNRRKVALLLAFAPRPDLLILDEPTSGLDPLMQHIFLAMIDEARGDGSTVFLSSHVLSEVQRAADRVAVLRAGRIVAQGTVDDLRSRVRQRIEAWFAEDVPEAELRSIPGLVDMTIEGRRLAGTLSGPIDPVVARPGSSPVGKPRGRGAGPRGRLPRPLRERSVSGSRTELVLGPLRQLRRSILGWGIGLGALVAVTIAFWPAFRGSSGISEAIDQLPAGVIDAFGLAGFGTPAGFLRGNLYEFIVPLLLAVAAVAAANSLTAGEEDAGRLELYLSEPLTRQSVFAGRVGALVGWMVAMTAIVLLVQLASDAVFGLAIETTKVVPTVVLCGLLALLYGTVALAIAGWLPRPSIVLAIGIAASVAGYLISALFPLSNALDALAGLSPWKWALGGDPLVNGAEPWRFVALILPAIGLVVIGVFGFVRRDVRAA